MKGWKQAYTAGYENLVIVELDIAEDAQIKHIKKYGFLKNFYTCDKATVASISSFDGLHHVDKAISLKALGFWYEIGKEVNAIKDESLGDRPGIYFFSTREDAVNYEF